MIDKGYGDLRFYQVYSYLLYPIANKIDVLKEKLMRRETSTD